MKNLVFVVILAVAFWLLWQRFWPEPSPPGKFLESQPGQEFTLALPIKREGFTLYPVASFEVDARVYGRRSYSDDSYEAKLSPVDLALGWGPLADELIADQIIVTQSERFYHWRSERPPIPPERISQSSANMHIIPADQEVMRFLDTVMPGQKVSLRGKLVNISGPENWRWVSSQTRNDTGEGACEVFYVERASPIPPPGVQPQKELPVAVQQAPATPRNAAPQKTASEERSVKVTKTKSFPIPYGSVTVPAGDTVRIAAEKGSKVKAVYRGIEFWVEKRELE
jgi:hypothetical protein